MVNSFLDGIDGETDENLAWNVDDEMLDTIHNWYVHKAISEYDDLITSQWRLWCAREEVMHKERPQNAMPDLQHEDARLGRMPALPLHVAWRWRKSFRVSWRSKGAVAHILP